MLAIIVILDDLSRFGARGGRGIAADAARVPRDIRSTKVYQTDRNILAG
jgi:hypothetical protein